MSAEALRPSGRAMWELGDYLIEGAIGSGQFGTVYQARHRLTDRDVALKLILRRGADADEKVAAERHGALLQQRFCRLHPGLVPEVYEHEPLGDFYAIAMELVHGQPLTDVIAAGRLPARRAATIALATAQFLQKAHQFATEVEGRRYELIVHADLKPAHILLLDNDAIRVLDFGIAKALQARTLVTTNKWGSVQYASPERLQSDGQVSEHADFWSLGVMLFEMVAGYRPYRRYEQRGLETAIRTQQAMEPLPDDTDPVLAAIVRKLLASQIERRYSSAAHIAQDLESFLQGGVTMAGSAHASASQETVRIAPAAGAALAPPPIPPALPATTASAAPVMSASVPTEPLKRPAAVPPVVPPAVAKALNRRARGSFIQRNWKRALIFGFIWVVAAEWIALVRAERLRDQLSVIEPADVAGVREEYQSIANAAVFDIGASLRLNRALKNRMIELADRTILDYRTETPLVAKVQWDQARVSLALAAEIAPDDRRIMSKHFYVRGHLERITARDRGDFEQAIRDFRQAARLDDSSPDPYLGLARIYAYSTWDADALTQALEEAGKRGYEIGRRERAQLGDVHRVHAERARTAADRMEGDDRTAELERAAAGFGRCAELFDGLKFFDSERNLRLCQRRLAAVKEELAAAPF